ncbi:hypothetical protein BH23CHL1_BH23CHL1_17390 [soil metagenome]
MNPTAFDRLPSSLSRLVTILVTLTMLASLAVFPGSVPQASAAEVRYTVTDLGTLGGSFSRANALNDAGQVTGEAETATGESHAFL